MKSIYLGSIVIILTVHSHLVLVWTSSVKSPVISIILLVIEDLKFTYHENYMLS
jgi:hypothetical protein